MKDSLHAQARKDQLQSINMENQALLKRLKDKMPHYSVAKWAKDFREEEKRSKLVSQMPQRFEKPKKKVRTRHLKSLSNPQQPKKVKNKTPDDLPYSCNTLIDDIPVSVEVANAESELEIKVKDLNSSELYTLKVPADQANSDFKRLVHMLRFKGNVLVLDSKAEEDVDGKEVVED